LYQRICNKASRYKAVVEQYDIPYIVALFGEFTAAMNSDELNACLFEEDYGLFRQTPRLTGLLYFEEQSGRYQFTFMPNPHTYNGLYIPSGRF